MFQEEGRAYAKIWQYKSPWHGKRTLRSSYGQEDQKSQLAQNSPVCACCPRKRLVCPQSQKWPRLDNKLYGHSKYAWDIQSKGEMEMGEMKAEGGRR